MNLNLLTMLLQAGVWPHHGANSESTSALWLGFLHYYAELFDYSSQVVCVRQLLPLNRTEKQWINHPIAIEDPFDLSRNLGSGVSRRSKFLNSLFIL